MPQKQELWKVQKNPTGIESEPELLKKIINNEWHLPEGHSTTS